MNPAVIGALVGWFAAQGIKSQLVRGLDVLVLGPLLIAGVLSKDARALIGGATVGYNLRNYLIQRQQQTAAEPLP